MEKHKNRPVILVSANGMELVKPAESLLKAGFERVFVLKDGLSGWTGDNLPLSRSKSNPAKDDWNIPFVTHTLYMDIKR